MSNFLIPTQKFSTDRKNLKIFQLMSWNKLKHFKQKYDFDLPKHFFIHLISNKITVIISFKYFLNFGKYFHDLNMMPSKS